MNDQKPNFQFDSKLLLYAIKRLTKISLEENKFLEKLDLNIADKYLKEKSALTIYMIESKKLLESNPELKKSISDEMLSEVTKAYGELEPILSLNLKLVSYGKAANKRIIEALRKTQKKPSTSVTYNKKRQKKEELTALNFIQQV